MPPLRLLLLLSLLPIPAMGQTYLPGKMPLFGPLPPPLPRFEPAPVPSQDATIPKPAPPTPGEPEFSAGFSNPTLPLRSGAGYAPGSNFNEEMLRKNRPGPSVGPGFAITVPLDK